MQRAKERGAHRSHSDDGPIRPGPWGKGFGDDFGDSAPGGPGSRMGRGPGIGGLDGDDPGRRRGRRVFGQGELRLVLLELIGQQERHGYELIKAVEELTGGNYAPSPGAVYPKLAMLEYEGLIAETGRGNSARKSFALTDSGNALLKREAEKVTRILERLRAMNRDAPRVSPPIRRAVGNLLIATRNRAQAEGFTDDTALRIAAILDDAAGRIERL